MYIFTDGITEIRDQEGKMLGSDGFKDYIMKYQSEPNNEKIKQNYSRSCQIWKNTKR